MITRHNCLHMIIGLLTFASRPSPGSVEEVENQMDRFLDLSIKELCAKRSRVEAIWGQRIACFWDLTDETIHSQLVAAIQACAQIQLQWHGGLSEVADIGPFGCLEIGGCSRFTFSAEPALFGSFGERLGFCRRVTEREDAVGLGPFLTGPRVKHYLEKFDSAQQWCHLRQTGLEENGLEIYGVDFPGM